MKKIMWQKEKSRQGIWTMQKLGNGKKTRTLDENKKSRMIGKDWTKKMRQVMSWKGCPRTIKEDFVSQSDVDLLRNQ